MFGRTKDATATPSAATRGADGTDGLGAGKGRRTPTRREAEAAARERAKSGPDKKTAVKQDRRRRAEQNATMRAGMRAGDERYLMERDKGPVKRFIRDYIDARISFMEFLLPLLVITIILQASNVDALVRFGAVVQSVSIVLLLVDVILLDFQLGRQLKRRFGPTEHSIRGWRFYAFMRAIQLRPLRMPKPQRKWREKLPDRY